jgi:hypothetical protein
MQETMYRSGFFCLDSTQQSRALGSPEADGFTKCMVSAVM